MPGKIIYNLKDFTKELVDYISSGAVVNAFMEAEGKYNQYKQSYFWWIYQHTRHSSEKFNNTISTLKNFDDIIIRLQEFQKFVSSGEWESTSANTQLFLFLINSIEGYVKESDDYLIKVIIPPLRELITEDIQSLVNQEQRAKKEAAERKKELAAMCAGKNRQLEDISLFTDAVAARLFAMKNPEKKAFFLRESGASSQSPQWELAWYDLTGKPVSLLIEGELKGLLAKIELPLLAEGNAVRQLLKIKAECGRLVEELLHKTQVLINPESSAVKNLISTYVVLQNDALIEISWYDSLGRSNPVKLGNYPEFQAWVNQLPDWSSDNILRLKTYLRHVNTRHEVDENKQINVRDLLQKQHGIALIATDECEKIPPYKLIPGTYILTREPDVTGEWILYQRQKGGINLKINTDSWELFHQVLAENDNQSAGALMMNIRDQLREQITAEIKATNKQSFYQAVRPPVSRLKMDDYSVVDTMLAKRMGTRLVKSAENSRPLPNKLDVTQFAIAGLFGHVPKARKEEIHLEHGNTPQDNPFRH
ncbi:MULTISPECIES: hypothetical protein [unclassified Legionella]|uniref:hypothetical protein n=1 Tax=unclassified Legionella TaxID=2622702 RepID=UPI001056794D|nr:MULTISPECIES: hypothetical protein [unclassified Legionella]MDI9817726.1 hypothetical protein [Legionella sp. PL877]